MVRAFRDLKQGSNLLVQFWSGFQAIAVVYFDQQYGAVHLIGWLNYSFFLFYFPLFPLVLQVFAYTISR